MRWWWFGPAVSKPELRRELEVMQKAGIGGVELQPVYPLEVDDTSRGIHNDAYLSPSFLDNVRYAAATAQQLGLRMDVTLGSGWPYGGPQTAGNESASRLRCVRVGIDGQTRSAIVPSLENGETLLAVFFEGGQRLTGIHDGRVYFPISDAKTRTLLFFISSRTGQQVKRASVGAEGFVLDHFGSQAIQHHLRNVADRLLSALHDHPPYSVFSDSLEVFGTDWTPDLPREFERRRGYDLLPHLPDLAADHPTAEGLAIRHDWAQTLTELAEERYLIPIREWAHARGTRFRSQTYGEPPVYLSSNALVDLPEGEAGPQWRTFNTARWASSASHLYRRPVTSTETWTWLHSPAFRATPLDMKAEADLHFIEGINQLVGHGWPYSPTQAGEPGQRFYAAAAFNEHNPWFQVMPDICAYLQRMSFLMRQGEPVRDIAIYLRTDDALAQSTLGHVSIDHPMADLLGPSLIPAVLDAGYNFDYIDDRAIEKVGIPYKLLVLPNVERMPLATLNRVRDYVRKGGIAIATHRLPSLSPGWANAGTESQAVSALAHSIFQGTPREETSGRAELIRDEAELPAELHRSLSPDLSIDPGAASRIGFAHRFSTASDIYFVVNTSNASLDTKLDFRAHRKTVEIWNPFTGQRSAPAGKRPLTVKFAPYESRVYVLHDEAALDREQPITVPAAESIPLNTAWTISFPALQKTETDASLHSWTEADATRYFSGEAVYERSLHLEKVPKDATLDFGPGEAVQSPAPSKAPGMRALLESPVRESAIVYVNGRRAGSVWHPPYELQISSLLHSGENQLRIVVANTAINELAARALPDYRLLNLRYGKRFEPQGFENLQPLASGIIGPLSLRVSQ